MHSLLYVVLCVSDESQGPSERDGGSRGLRLCQTVNAAVHQVSVLCTTALNFIHLPVCGQTIDYTSDLIDSLLTKSQGRLAFAFDCSVNFFTCSITFTRTSNILNFL